MKPSELKALEKERVKISQKIWAAEALEREKENKNLIGKCFKYRNCYSCPEKESDYWYIYTMIRSADGHKLRAHEFQVDKNGRVEINAKAEYFRSLTDGWREIPDTEYFLAWNALIKKILRMKPPI